MSVEALRDENERLRAALRYYASAELWKSWGSDSRMSNARVDGGHHARVVLSNLPAQPDSTTNGDPA